MADLESAEEKLARLRELILNARSMPMSASCVINRSDVLAAIDEVIENLPDEVAEAQQVIDRSVAKIGEGQAEAAKILAEAREHATQLAQDGEVVRVGQELAAKLTADAEAEAVALRRETDAFIDSRMASFESVLHKTASQVKTARFRLAERSELNGADPGKGADPAQVASAADPANQRTKR
jgi:regulator of protease activity HflC (stomatin/prohibitin superfamily)